MEKVQAMLESIWKIAPENFEQIALQVFRYQAENIPVYKEFLQLLDVNPSSINQIVDIPFLPIEVFKSHQVTPNNLSPALIFESSGTTGVNTSKHFVADEEIYKTSIRTAFQKFYGHPSQYYILALLPSYLERKNASLVYMCNYLMQLSGNAGNGFFLDNQIALEDTLKKNELQKIKTLLIGVSYALLEFAEKYAMPLQHTFIMETGGMKGKRKELTRQELHVQLQNAFGLQNIHSEYGMTELLSQSYSAENGIFYSPPWKKILIRDAEDPFTILGKNRNGIINIIDLANIYSCSFIATADTGMVMDDNGFTVTGRFDNADIRGCNLMVL